MSTTPKVSVIMPVFNAAAYLPAALDSVLGQSLREIELIAIDDGSTDDSLAVLQAVQDARLRVISRANRGVGPTRNEGIFAASGEYIFFLDPDDRIASPGVLELLYTKAVEHGVSICGGSLCRIYDEQVDTSVLPGFEKQHFSEEGLVNYADYQYHYGFYRFIYKRSLLVEHQVEFPPLCRYQDPPFMVRAMLAAGKFYAVPQVTYAYRKEHRQLKWQKRHTEALYAGLAEVWQQAKKYHMPHLQQEVHANLCDHFARSQKYLTPAHNAFIREVETTVGKQSLIPLLEPDNCVLRFLKRLFVKKTLTKISYRFFCVPIWSRHFKAGSAAVLVLGMAVSNNM